MNFDWKKYIKIGICVFGVYLCIHYWKTAAELISTMLAASFPLFVGAVIAYFVNILMSFYEKHYFVKSDKRAVIKSRRPVCMLGAFLTMLAIIALVVGLVVPQLISCCQLIFAKLPAAISAVAEYAQKLNFVPENIVSFIEETDWKSRIGEIIKAFGSGVGSVMDIVVKTVSSLFSGLVTGLLSVIFAIYLLASKDKLRSQINRVMKHYLSDKICEKINYAAAILNDSFHRYIVGQCTEAVILGLLCMIGMMILRLSYASMIGALVAFTALIPIAGAYIGAIVGAFMLFTVSPVQALIFLIFIVVLQQAEGNLIYPKVVGSSIGLPGIWVLAAVTVGGGIMGVTGMLIAVPLTAAFYRMLRDDMNKGELKK